MAGRDTRGGQYVDTGHVLSKYSGWQDAKSNPALWFLILLFNALFTTIGVGIRDFCDGECMLTKENPFGTFCRTDRAAFYGITVAICGLSFIIMAILNVLYHSWRVLPNKENNIEKDKTLNASCTIIQYLLINFFIVASGTLYIAADNYFFLVDPMDGESNGSHIRSFLAGSSLVCTACVFAINQWFKKFNCTKSEETSCSEDCRQIHENSDPRICRHGRDHTNCRHASNECIHRYENGICTLHCCTPHYFKERREICEHGRDHTKCKIECDYVENELKKDTSKECLKFVIFWYPLPIIIATFDSIFLSVVDEVSDENNRKGFDCESNMFGRNGALIFYIVIALLMWASIIGITVVRSWNMYTYICQVDKTASRKQYKCGIITYSIIMCTIFIVMGTLFTAVDNNWPWICFAGEICSWVISRISLLASLTVIIFFFTIVIFIVTLGLWCLECSAKREDRSHCRTHGGPGGGSHGELGSRPDSGPDSRSGDDPNSGPGDNPNSRPGDNPNSRPGDNPNSGPGDDPNSGPGDNPNSGPGDDPNSGPGDDPNSGPGDNPNSGPGDDSNSGPGDDSNSGPGDEPDSRPGDKPEHVTRDGQMSRPQTLDQPCEDVPTNTRQKVKYDMVQEHDDKSHSTESDIQMQLLQESERKPDTVTGDACEC